MAKPIKKSGGIWFWKIGRIGGSFYLAKSKNQRRYLIPVSTPVLGAITGIVWVALAAVIAFG